VKLDAALLNTQKVISYLVYKIIANVIRNLYRTTFPWRFIRAENAACPLTVFPFALVFPPFTLKLTTTYWALLQRPIEDHILTEATTSLSEIRRKISI
jgi:hypothetical protein